MSSVQITNFLQIPQLIPKYVMGMRSTTQRNRNKNQDHHIDEKRKGKTPTKKRTTQTQYQQINLFKIGKNQNRVKCAETQ